MRVCRSIPTRERRVDTKISAERETPRTFTLGRENGKGKDVCRRRCPPMAHLISPPFSRHVKPLKYEPPRRTHRRTVSLPPQPPTDAGHRSNLQLTPFPTAAVIVRRRRRRRRDRVKRRRVWLSPNPQTETRRRPTKPAAGEQQQPPSVVPNGVISLSS